MTRNLLRAAQRQGWRVERTNGGHYRWRSPDRSVPKLFLEALLLPSGREKFVGTVASRWTCILTLEELLMHNFNPHDVICEVASSEFDDFLFVTVKDSNICDHKYIEGRRTPFPH